MVEAYRGCVSLTIVGAGLAGLLAAHAWPQARVIESSDKPKSEHKALLRFRSDAVARLTGIDFKKVTVRKGIWLDGKFIKPDIRAANMYAQKVTGSLSGERSIWNLEPVERFIAPETLYDEMVANVGARITWGKEFDYNAIEAPIVNTAPLSIVLKKVGMAGAAQIPFLRAPIVVQRYRVADANVYQTVYFPDEKLALYRASITGSLLIVESVFREDGALVPDAMGHVSAAFGIPGPHEFIDAVEQKYGKIVPLLEAERKRILHDLTAKCGIFSLGRFATWRNVLLDDVVRDIDVIRRLMKATSYDRRMFAS